MIKFLGEDPDREGLRDTPKRYVAAIIFFTSGYRRDLNAIVNGAIFQESHKGMVITRDIEFSSLCEHHLTPFRGRVRQH